MFTCAADSLTNQWDQQFSTLDADHDQEPTYSCAVLCRGGWWYNGCLESNLNGLYNSTAYSVGVDWTSWRGYYYSLRTTEMKIRPAA